MNFHEQKRDWQPGGTVVKLVESRRGQSGWKL